MLPAKITDWGSRLQISPAELLKLGYLQLSRDAAMCGMSVEPDSTLSYEEALDLLEQVIRNTGDEQLSSWLYRIDLPESISTGTPRELAAAILYRSCQKVYTRLYYGS